MLGPFIFWDTPKYWWFLFLVAGLVIFMLLRSLRAFRAVLADEKDGKISRIETSNSQETVSFRWLTPNVKETLYLFQLKWMISQVGGINHPCKIARSSSLAIFPGASSLYVLVMQAPQLFGSLWNAWRCLAKHLRFSVGLGRYCFQSSLGMPSTVSQHCSWWRGCFLFGPKVLGMARAWISEVVDTKFEELRPLPLLIWWDYSQKASVSVSNCFFARHITHIQDQWRWWLQELKFCYVARPKSNEVRNAITDGYAFILLCVAWSIWGSQENSPFPDPTMEILSDDDEEMELRGFGWE